MLNLLDQVFYTDVTFDSAQLKEIMAPKELVIIADFDFNESIEIDELQIDKIYQSL